MKHLFDLKSHITTHTFLIKGIQLDSSLTFIDIVCGKVYIYYLNERIYEYEDEAVETIYIYYNDVYLHSGVFRGSFVVHIERKQC